MDQNQRHNGPNSERGEGDRSQAHDDPSSHRRGHQHPHTQEEFTSEFQEILANYREFDRFGAEIQHGITEAFLRDEGWRKRVAAFMDLSDIRALEEIHKIIATVVDIMPCASSQGVNIFSTIAAHHSNVTGNPTLSHIIDLINKETSKNPAYESDEDP
jgi:hypothetical protein